MNPRPLWLVVNRIMLALFGIALALASVVAIHEIFFAIPECPGGVPSCPMRTGHFTGSRLVGATLLAMWAFVLLWVMATRRQEAIGRAAFLPLFWAGPLLLFCFFYFQ